MPDSQRRNEGAVKVADIAGYSKARHWYPQKQLDKSLANDFQTTKPKTID